jgi:hypothetical protein
MALRPLHRSTPARRAEAFKLEYVFFCKNASASIRRCLIADDEQDRETSLLIAAVGVDRRRLAILTTEAFLRGERPRTRAEATAGSAPRQTS